MTETKVGKLVVEVVGDSSGLVNAYKEAEQQTSALEKKLQSYGDSLTSAGKKMTLGVTTPLMLMGGLAVSTAADFDDSMRQVQAVTGATGDQFDKLRQQAIDLGASTAWSASQVAEAQKYLAKAGLDVNQVLEATPQMLSLASGGFLDLGSAADIATNILSGFDLEVSDLGHVSDLLAKAASTANTSVQQMGDAMAYVGPVASEANQSIEMTTAAIQIMSNSGIQGSMAGTALRSSLAALLSPTAEAQKILASYGLTAADVNPEVHSLAEIVETLGNAGISAGDSLQLFGERGGPGMMKVVSAGREELEKYTVALEDCDGAALKMAETMEGGAGGSIRELEGKIETLSITFGDLIADALIPAGESVGDIANWLSSLDEGTQRSIVTVGLFAAAVGPATWALGSMAGGVSSMIGLYRTYQASTIASTIATKGFTAAIAANPVGLAIIGVTTLAAVLIPLIASTEDATKAQDEYNKALDETVDLTEKTDEQLQDEIETLKEKSAKIREQIEMLKNQHTPAIQANIRVVQKSSDETAFHALTQGTLTRQMLQTKEAMNDGTYAVQGLDTAQQGATISALELKDAEIQNAIQIREVEQELRALADGAKTAYDQTTREVNRHRDAVSDLQKQYDSLKETIDTALGIDEEIDDSGRDIERADIRLIQAKNDLQEIQAEIKELEKNKNTGDAEERDKSSKELERLRLRERSAVLDLADAEDRLSDAQKDQQKLIEEKAAVEEKLNGESIDSAQNRLDELSILLEDETAALEKAQEDQKTAKIVYETAMNEIELQSLETKSENWKKYVEFVNNNPAIARTYNVVYDENGKASVDISVPTINIEAPKYNSPDFVGVSKNATPTPMQQQGAIPERPSSANASKKTEINITNEIYANDTDTSMDLANKISKLTIRNALGGAGMG